MMKVLLAGATGLVGHELLKQLIAESVVGEIHVLTRRPLLIESPKIRLHHTSLGEHWLDSVSGLTFDSVFCCLGTTMKAAGSQDAFRRVDFDAVVQLAKFAKSHSRFFGMVSSVGADSHSGNFYLKVKGEAEDAVRALGIPSLAILNPSLLMGDRKESRPGEKFAMAVMPAVNFLLVGGLRKYRGIEASEVARQLLASSTKASL
jgi:uncharacterized protein YbjT (DUF2867 family)